MRPASSRPTREVAKTFGGDALWLVEVAQIDHERRGEPGFQRGEVERPELVPLGRDDDAVGAFGGLVGVGAVVDRRQQGLRRRHRRRVEGADLRAALHESLDHRNGGRVAHVVRVALEGQAEYGDRLAGEAVEGGFDLADHAVLDALVGRQHGFDDLELHAVLLGDLRHRPGVLREAGAAVAGAGVEELRTDAVVEPHAAGDDLDVGADPLAELRDLVDEGDLGRQEAVGGVLDHLGRLDIGDHERHTGGLERGVDVEHDVDGALRARADDDAVGAEEVLDRRAFAQELGVRDHRELLLAARVLAHRALDHLTGADRHGRLRDDDLVAVQVVADRLGDLADEGEVGLAVGERRRAHRDEDRARLADRRREVGGELEPPGADVLLDDLLEPGLVDRNLPAHERLDLACILVHAGDRHAEIGQAGSRDQADVSTADDTDLHESPFCHSRLELVVLWRSCP